MNSNYKIMALGGLGENGKNSYVFETEKDMVVIDFGLQHFTNRIVGIDYVIPDIEYILERKDKLRAVIVSHGHLDQMGGISNLLNKVDVNIFASNYTISFLKGYLPKSKYKFLKEFKYEKVLKLGEISVESFRLSHAIFGNLGFVVSYKSDAVVYVTDYNFDQVASEFARTDIRKIIKLSEKYNIRALMSESVNVDQKGSAASFQNILVQFKRQLEIIKGRLIISVYSSNLAGMNNIINLASEMEKKIVIIGRDLLTYVNVAKEYGYIEHQRDLFIRIKDMSKYKDEEIIIVVADLHMKLFMELEKMATKKHNIVQISPDDTVMIASKPNDEVEGYAQQVMDKISRTGAKIVNQKINIASHAQEEDLKMMINLFSPQILVPIKGEYRKFVAFRKIGMQLGYDSDAIKFLENGENLEVFDTTELVTSKEQLQEVYVNSKSTEVDQILLKDRESLSQNGYLIVILPFFKRTMNLAQEPEILFPEEIEGIISEKIKEGCLNVIKKEVAKDYNKRELINKVKVKVARYVQNKANKTIMVLPMKIEIDPKVR